MAGPPPAPLAWEMPPLSVPPPVSEAVAEPSRVGVFGLAEAFNAFLAAEQGEPLPSGRVVSSLFETPVLTDDLVEHVSRRVLERLSERTVRETVADIVSSVAERMVREEIDRIKAGLRK
jgi:hypothetical protein